MHGKTDNRSAIYPVQAFLYAKIVNVFTLKGRDLIHEGDFWSLMFFILAIGSFLAYFVLGWTAHVIQAVSPLTDSKFEEVNIRRL